MNENLILCRMVQRKGPVRAFPNKNSKLLIHKLNSIGLKIQFRLTPPRSDFLFVTCGIKSSVFEL